MSNYPSGQGQGGWPTIHGHPCPPGAPVFPCGNLNQGFVPVLPHNILRYIPPPIQRHDALHQPFFNSAPQSLPNEADPPRGVPNHPIPLQNESNFISTSRPGTYNNLPLFTPTASKPASSEVIPGAEHMDCVLRKAAQKAASNGVRLEAPPTPPGQSPPKQQVTPNLEHIHISPFGRLKKILDIRPPEGDDRRVTKRLNPGVAEFTPKFTSGSSSARTSFDEDDCLELPADPSDKMNASALNSTKNPDNTPSTPCTDAGQTSSVPVCLNLNTNNISPHTVPLSFSDLSYSDPSDTSPKGWSTWNQTDDTAEDQSSDGKTDSLKTAGLNPELPDSVQLHSKDESPTFGWSHGADNITSNQKHGNKSDRGTADFNPLLVGHFMDAKEGDADGAKIANSKPEVEKNTDSFQKQRSSDTLKTDDLKPEAERMDNLGNSKIDNFKLMVGNFITSTPKYLGTENSENDNFKAIAGNLTYNVKTQGKDHDFKTTDTEKDSEKLMEDIKKDGKESDSMTMDMKSGVSEMQHAHDPWTSAGNGDLHWDCGEKQSTVPSCVKTWMGNDDDAHTLCPKMSEKRHKSCQTEGPMYAERKKVPDHASSRKVMALQAELCQLRAQLCLNELHRERVHLELDMFWWSSNFQPVIPSPVSRSVTAVEKQLKKVMSQMKHVEVQRDLCLGILRSGQELQEVPNFAITLPSGEMITPIHPMVKGTSTAPAFPSATAVPRCSAHTFLYPGGSFQSGFPPTCTVQSYQSPVAVTSQTPTAAGMSSVYGSCTKKKRLDVDQDTSGSIQRPSRSDLAGFSPIGDVSIVTQTESHAECEATSAVKTVDAGDGKCVLSTAVFSEAKPDCKPCVLSSECSLVSSVAVAVSAQENISSATGPVSNKNDRGVPASESVDVSTAAGVAPLDNTSVMGLPADRRDMSTVSPVSHVNGEDSAMVVGSLSVTSDFDLKSSTRVLLSGHSNEKPMGIPSTSGAEAVPADHLKDESSPETEPLDCVKDNLASSGSNTEIPIDPPQDETKLDIISSAETSTDKGKTDFAGDSLVSDKTEDKSCLVEAAESSVETLPSGQAKKAEPQPSGLSNDESCLAVSPGETDQSKEQSHKSRCPQSSAESSSSTSSPTEKIDECSRQFMVSPILSRIQESVAMSDTTGLGSGTEDCMLQKMTSTLRASTEPGQIDARKEAALPVQENVKGSKGTEGLKGASPSSQEHQTSHPADGKQLHRNVYQQSADMKNGNSDKTADVFFDAKSTLSESSEVFCDAKSSIQHRNDMQSNNATKYFSVSDFKEESSLDVFHSVFEKTVSDNSVSSTPGKSSFLSEVISSETSGSNGQCDQSSSSGYLTHSSGDTETCEDLSYQTSNGSNTSGVHLSPQEKENARQQHSVSSECKGVVPHNQENKLNMTNGGPEGEKNPCEGDKKNICKQANNAMVSNSVGENLCGKMNGTHVTAERDHCKEIDMFAVESDSDEDQPSPTSHNTGAETNGSVVGSTDLDSKKNEPSIVKAAGCETRSCSSSPVNSSQIGSSPVNSSQIGSSPVNSSQIGSSPVNSSQIGSSPVNSSQIGSSPVNSSQVGSSPVNSSQVGSSPVNSSQIGSSPTNASSPHSLMLPGENQTPGPLAQNMPLPSTPPRSSTGTPVSVVTQAAVSSLNLSSVETGEKAVGGPEGKGKNVATKTDPAVVFSRVIGKLKELYPDRASDVAWLQEMAQEQTKLLLQQLESTSCSERASADPSPPASQHYGVAPPSLADSTASTAHSFSMAPSSLPVQTSTQNVGMTPSLSLADPTALAAHGFSMASPSLTQTSTPAAHSFRVTPPLSLADSTAHGFSLTPPSTAHGFNVTPQSWSLAGGAAPPSHGENVQRTRQEQQAQAADLNQVWQNQIMETMRKVESVQSRRKAVHHRKTPPFQSLRTDRNKNMDMARESVLVQRTEAVTQQTCLLERSAALEQQLQTLNQRCMADPANTILGLELQNMLRQNQILLDQAQALGRRVASLDQQYLALHATLPVQYPTAPNGPQQSTALSVPQQSVMKSSSVHQSFYPHYFRPDVASAYPPQSLFQPISVTLPPGQTTSGLTSPTFGLPSPYASLAGFPSPTGFPSASGDWSFSAGAVALQSPASLSPDSLASSGHSYFTTPHPSLLTSTTPPSAAPGLSIPGSAVSNPAGIRSGFGGHATTIEAVFKTVFTKGDGHSKAGDGPVSSTWTDGRSAEIPSRTAEKKTANSSVYMFGVSSGSAFKRSESPAVKRSESPAFKKSESSAVKRSESPALKRSEYSALKRSESPAVKTSETPAVTYASQRFSFSQNVGHSSSPSFPTTATSTTTTVTTAIPSLFATTSSKMMPRPGSGAEKSGQRTIPSLLSAFVHTTTSTKGSALQQTQYAHTAQPPTQTPQTDEPSISSASTPATSSPEAFRPLLPLKPIKMSSNRFAVLSSSGFGKSLDVASATGKKEVCDVDSVSTSSPTSDREWTRKKKGDYELRGEENTTSKKRNVQEKSTKRDPLKDLEDIDEEEQWQISTSKRRNRSQNKKSQPRQRNAAPAAHRGNSNRRKDSGGYTSPQQHSTMSRTSPVPQTQATGQGTKSDKAYFTFGRMSNQRSAPSHRPENSENGPQSFKSPPSLLSLDLKSVEDSRGSSSVPQLDQFSFSKKLDKTDEYLSRPRPNISKDFIGRLVRDNEVANYGMGSSNNASQTAKKSSRCDFDKQLEGKRAASDDWNKMGKKGLLPTPNVQETSEAGSSNAATAMTMQNTKDHPSKMTAYKKLCLAIQTDFPNLKHQDTVKVIDEVKRSYGGHFHGKLFSDIMKDIRALVLQQFPDKLRAGQSKPVFTELHGSMMKTTKTIAPEKKWQQSTEPGGASFKGSDEECSICLAEFTARPPFSLDCGHSFHKQCIDKWVKNQGERTCPICRTLVLMQEDFPHLGRERSTSIPHPQPASRYDDKEFPRLGATLLK